MTITDEDMYIAAVTLASCVSQSQLDIGNAYPPLSSIRDVSQVEKNAYYILKKCPDISRSIQGFCITHFR